MANLPPPKRRPSRSRVPSAAAHSHRAVLVADRRVFLCPAFGPLRPRMHYRPMQYGAPALAGGLRVRGPAQRDLLAQAPPASRPVAARNCSMVAMPASTLNTRFSRLSGRTVKRLATASWHVAPKRVRRTTPPRPPPISTTVVRTATRVAWTARWTRWQYPFPVKSKGVYPVRPQAIGAQPHSPHRIPTPWQPVAEAQRGPTPLSSLVAPCHSTRMKTIVLVRKLRIHQCQSHRE